MGRLRGMAVSLSEHVQRLPVVTINLIATHSAHVQTHSRFIWAQVCRLCRLSLLRHRRGVCLAGVPEAGRGSVG
jgi:hypothetical protein